MIPPRGRRKEVRFPVPYDDLEIGIPFFVPAVDEVDMSLVRMSTYQANQRNRLKHFVTRICPKGLNVWRTK